MPRVSVIIPAFNAEEHIAEALDSVASQTYCDWEIVVVDDGSTDATREVVERFSRSLRLRLASSPSSLGPAAARNRAIGLATGELLAFLDADDYWLPGYLEHQVGVYDTVQEGGRNRIGIVGCDARILDAEGFRARTYLEQLGLGGNVTVTSLLRSNPIFVSAVTPMHIIREVGGFAEDLRGTEDHDLWLRILEMGYGAIISRVPLAVYRVRGNSVSSDPRAMARGAQALLRRARTRGNLTPRQRRIAGRELRRHVALERVASPNGHSYASMLKALPLLGMVAVENPRRWPSFVRVAASRGRRLTRSAR